MATATVSSFRSPASKAAVAGVQEEVLEKLVGMPAAQQPDQAPTRAWLSPHLLDTDAREALTGILRLGHGVFQEGGVPDSIR